MNKNKKPNYKLRRKVAKYVFIMLILLPIIIINRTKIFNFTIYVPNMKYSKVIDSMFKANYNKDEIKNTLDYLKKKKKINDNTSNYILKLNSKGYNKKTIDFLIKNLNKSEMTEFLAKKYNKDYEKYIANKLFDYSKFDRYLAYRKDHKDLSIDDTVWQIELNMDKTYYDDSELIEDPDNILVLANKYYEIPENYVPNDLVEMDDKYANNQYSRMKLRKEAYEQFVKMCDDARKDGVNFYAESAYRSYSYQKSIYNNYVYNNGQAKADKYAAKPGFSEHELGLAIDLANVWTITTKGKEYAWISKNGYKYGYIFRYKEEWENVTGYSAESWHIRYVGSDVAKQIVKKNMSYEEYYIKYIKNKKN